MSAPTKATLADEVERGLAKYLELAAKYRASLTADEEKCVRSAFGSGVQWGAVIALRMVDLGHEERLELARRVIEATR